MLYCCWDMARDRCNCYFSFWAIFCPFTLWESKIPKFFKKWKKHLEIHHFTYVYWKLSDDVWFLRYGAQWTDGQMERGMDGETDGWMAIWIEKMIYRGGCPIKKIWSEFLMRNIFKWLILSKWTDRTSDDLNGHHVAGSPVTIHCWIASRIF